VAKVFILKRKASVKEGAFFWTNKSNAIALQKKCFYTIRAMLFQLKSIALTFHLRPTYIIRCGVWGC